MHHEYRFRAHGLEFASAIPLPHAVAPSVGSPDIRIRLGAMPDRLPEPVTPRGRAMVSREEVVIRSIRIGAYWIARGKTIVVEPVPGRSLADVASLLMGAALGAALLQRGTLALHAGAVSRDGRAVVLLGRSGSGKSSSVAALARRGYRILDDNIAVLTDGDGRFMVQPGVAELRLLSDAAYPAGCGTPAPYLRGLGKSRASIDAYFQPYPVTLAAIYLVTPAAVTAPVVRPLARRAAFAAAQQHVFCGYMRSAEQERRMFPALAQLAAAVPFTELSRPLSPSDPDLVADVVERDLRRLSGENTSA